MKALIIFGHPNIDSFNGSMLKTVEEALKEEGHEYILKNLYDQNFNPMFTLNDLIKIQNKTRDEDIAIEQIDVVESEVIIFIFPIWWGGPPAILKGWFDRVFTEGFAFEEKEDNKIQGLLYKKKAIIFATSGSSIDNQEQRDIFSAIETILVKGTLNFCGIGNVTYRNYQEVPYTTDEVRNNILLEVKNLIKSI